MTKKKLIWQLPFLLLLIVGTILIIRQQQAMPYQLNKGPVFGTFYTINYQSDKDYHEEIKAALQDVDDALSMFNEQSIISHINRGDDGEANDMFMEVFNKAMEVSKETDGAFDITVAPLVNAWGFGFKNGELPTRQQVDSIRQFIGWKKVTAEGKTIKKTDRRVMLDCSAIAKGYGVDVVARLLKDKGITNFMVEIGGEIITKGISPKRVPWKIGVIKPTEDSLQTSGEYQTILNVTDKAMATSGNYRNFYYKGGKRYAHTIDPKTGYPVQHNILSATVLAKDCATADAYATSFMVMGLEGAKVILERHPELMAYLIYNNQDNNLAVWYSPSMKDKIER
ncbi:MAG: FAD:protein FMN transferase [Prevotella sp.]|nr:FAD:protein FMN transferase [Prevotella sp.]